MTEKEFIDLYEKMTEENKKIITAYAHELLAEQEGGENDGKRVQA